MKSLFALALAVCVGSTALSAQSVEADQEAVKAVIQTAYIEGIHNERDLDKIAGGFHDEFNMLVLRDNVLGKVSIQQWSEGIGRSLESNPEPPEVPVHAEYAAVEVSGFAAVARIEVYRGERHLYTDFMSLYKFDDGWKIVNKIYFSHPG